jgi:hypothetical protein
MSSINQKYCWDTGATLSRNKAPRRIETSTLWTPSPEALNSDTLKWKASPCHITLRKEGSQAARCWLQTCLGDIQQTNRWAPSITWYSPSHPRDKPAKPPGQTDPLLCKRTKQNKTKSKELNTNKQKREQGAVGTQEKWGGARSRSLWTFSKQRLERQKSQQQARDELLPEIG